MPFEIMDKRSVSSPSHFFEELSFPPERQIGFWKPKTTHDQQVETDGISATLGGEVVSSSPLEKLLPIGVRPVVATDLKEKHVGGEGTPNFSSSSWKIMDDLPKSWSNLSMQPTSYCMDGKMININGTQYESSLFSSSLSEIFSSKLRLPGKDVLFHQPSSAVASHYEEEPFESLEEIEAQTIGNLLPDGDDLFSGLMDELGHYVNANTGDDIDDFDLFSSGGGMELEGSDHLRMGKRKSDFIGVSNGPGVSNVYIIHEHPNGELPSRSLLVRNIDFNVEDSELKGLFELYGDIRSIYTSWKRHDFVIISYYDLRAARNAMKELQRKQFRGRKLDILYCIPKVNPLEKDVNQGTLVVLNLDSSVSSDNLRQIFGIYGEIKEIRETPQKSHHKFIEFYDVRAAEAALRALNKSEIAGKQVKLELSLQGAARRCLMPQSERGQDESSIFRSACDNYSMSGRLDMIRPKKFTHGVVASRCMDSATQSPVSAFIENTFPHPSSSTSPARVASVGNQFGLRELNHSMGEVKFGNQGIPSFHPHSLPEYHDSLANGIPCNSSINIADMANNASPRMAEGIDKRHIQGVSLNGGVFGSSGNGSSPLHRHIWNNSNSYQHGPPNPMIWPNSPSFANGVHAHRLQQMPGFPGVPPHMMTSVSPVHHHVGSAPAVNPSIWDRRYAYSGESPEASSFQLGSVGSVGFPTGSPLPPMEISSHSVFSPVGGNCMDMTSNAGFRSPQMCHIFPGRNPMISLPASFDSPNDRVRNLSHRRNEANSNTVDKKQYELDIDRILRGEDTRTTLMLKNIPNKYTSKMLLAAIDEHCRGTYDFIYLPIDFKNKCNVGYAFINMIDPLKILPFHQAFSGKKWEKFNSEKVAYLAYARIQGKTALIAHFQNSSLMNEDKRCRPILFHTDGPNAGDQEPFPMGTNIRSRPGKSRSSGNEENHNQGGSSIFANGEESSNGRDSSPGSSKDSD